MKTLNREKLPNDKIEMEFDWYCLYAGDFILIRWLLVKYIAS
jgi:hypothetical protein